MTSELGNLNHQYEYCNLEHLVGNILNIKIKIFCITILEILLDKTVYENYIISIIFRNLITMSATKRYHLIKENMKKNVTKFGNKPMIG